MQTQKTNSPNLRTGSNSNRTAGGVVLRSDDENPNTILKNLPNLSNGENSLNIIKLGENGPGSAYIYILINELNNYKCVEPINILRTVLTHENVKHLATGLHSQIRFQLVHLKMGAENHVVFAMR